MSRPQGVQSDNFVDASAWLASRRTGNAQSATTLTRSYAVASLPRLQQAGAGAGSVQVSFRFLSVDGRIAIDGELDGVVGVTCQRCLQPVQVPLQEHFKVILVQDEAETEQEIAGYEPVQADPEHLDLLALAEDQALLALPLVPRHESIDCGEVPAASADAADEAEARQTPFSNLRDLLRER